MGMALIWKNTATEVSEPVKSGFSWDAWYEKNKTRLSEKRARRYREDAAYRNKALERSRAQRGTKKVTPTGDHTVSFNDAAQAVGVTVWVLREWRRKDYFPEPHRRDGRLWFTPSQVNLLSSLKDYFATHGSRVSDQNRSGLEDVVRLTYANWD
jgi:hypothetical protein